ncbi:MAG TPA: ATP-binding protein, partial [Coriobacteriia bacterium]
GIVVEAEGRYAFVNPAFVRMLGAASPEELLGRRILDTVPPQDQPAVAEAMRRVGVDRSPVTSFRHRMLGVDWRVFTVEVSAAPIEFQGKRASQAFIRDVTEREEALAARRQAEEFARTVIDAMPLGVYTWVLEPDGRLVLTGANPAADRIAGARHAERIGKAFEEVLPMLAGTGLDAIYARIATEGGSWEQQDFAALAPDGRTRYFDLHAFGTGKGTLAVAFQDTTESVQAQQELAAYRERLEAAVEERTAELTETNLALEQATRAKSAFLANMSHELRTPLNSIIGFSSVLSQGMAGPLNEEQERQVGMINRAGRQLLSLVGDVLDLEKIESGRIEVSVSEFALPPFVRQLAESVRPMTAEKGLRLEVSAAKAPAVMRGDRHRIQQVVLNFLSNAIKYTESGFVDLNVSATDDGTVVFRVSDSGIGIAPEDLDRVFDEFRQLPAIASAKNPGSGLGLSIARHLAELMGGRIEVESQSGRGSTFTLVVPQAPPQSPPQTRPDAPPRDRQSGA